MRALAASAALFGVWMVSWLVAAVWSRRTQARSSFAGELLHRVPTVIGWVMVGGAVRLRIDGLALWGLPPALDWTLTGAVAVGFAFTWWARLTLGDLWSGAITRKEGHHVVESGPYALVRHPIYTGLILAFFAAGVQSGRPLGMLGAVLVAFGFWLKGRIEERFLAAELGEAAYADYRRRVPMLIPFWPTGR